MKILKMIKNRLNRKDMIKEALSNGSKIIDVRTKQEFNQGNVSGSLNVPLDTISSKVHELKKMKSPLILCCASGMRSGSATSFLKQNGLECINAGSWMNLR